MRVLVAGGAGYIGSVVTAALLAGGHEVTVLDDLSTGHADAVPAGRDARRGLAARLGAGARRGPPRGGAALRGQEPRRRRPSSSPRTTGTPTSAGSLALLEAMRAADCRRIVFSSTAATYGEPESVPIREDAPDPADEHLRRLEARRRPHADLLRGRARLRGGEPAVLQRGGGGLRARRAARDRDPPHPDRAAGRRRAAGVDDGLRRGLPDAGRHVHPRLRPRRRPRRRPPAGPARAGGRASTGSTTWATAPASRCRRSSTPSAR